MRVDAGETRAHEYRDRGRRLGPGDQRRLPAVHLPAVPAGRWIVDAQPGRAGPGAGDCAPSDRVERRLHSRGEPRSRARARRSRSGCRTPCRALARDRRSEPARTSAGPSSTGRRVLVVDDNEDTRNVLLTHARGARRARDDGGVGRRRAGRLDARRPDVLVTDLAMPVEDGFGLLDYCRHHADPRLQALPILALTAYGGQQAEDRVLAAGFDAYLAKPVEPAEVGRVVRELPTAAHDDEAELRRFLQLGDERLERGEIRLVGLRRTPSCSPARTSCLRASCRRSGCSCRRRPGCRTADSARARGRRPSAPPSVIMTRLSGIEALFRSM